MAAAASLDQGEVPEELKKAFNSAGYPLPDPLEVVVQDAGSLWIIRQPRQAAGADSEAPKEKGHQPAGPSYSAYIEDGKLNVYRGSIAYKLAVEEAEHDAERAVELAEEFGIGFGGAVDLVRNDPAKTFAAKCSSCHRYDGHDGTGAPVADPQTAPDLAGFGSRAWIEGLLDPERVDSPHYFGGTAFKEGDMAAFVKDSVAAFEDPQKQNLAKAVKALSAEAHLPYQQELDSDDAEEIAAGRELLAGNEGELGCIDCHKYHDAGDLGSAPTLTDYASERWLIGMIREPTHEKYYYDRNDRMPNFGDGGLTERQLELLVKWLRMDPHRHDADADHAHAEPEPKGKDKGKPKPKPKEKAPEEKAK